jgi:urease accessory protein
VQVLSEVVGHHTDEELHDRLHELDGRGLVVRLVLPTAELGRRRFKATGSDGEEYGVALGRDAVLRDGSVLRLDEAGAVVVEVEEPALLELRATSLEGAVQLGWHAGHLHWRVRMAGDRVDVLLDGPREDYLARIRPWLENGAVEVVA